MAKKYKIASVDYEFCFIRGPKEVYEYTPQQTRDIALFTSSWADCRIGHCSKYPTHGFDPTDGYDYVNSVEELVPPHLRGIDR